MLRDGEFPMLRLELQAAKMTLLTHLSERHEEIQRMIEGSFDKAIGHIREQLDAQVYAALSKVFRQAIDTAAENCSEKFAEELAGAMSGQVETLIRKQFKSK